MSSPYTNTRVVWIDSTKAVAMYAVVLGHTSGFLFVERTILDRLIVSFNMYLFVMISAFCAYKSISRIHDFSSLWQYYRKILFSIGLPSVAFGLINQLAMSVTFVDSKLHFGYKTFSISFFLLILLVLITRQIIQRKIEIERNLYALVLLFLNVFIPWICNLWFFPMIIEVSMLVAFIVMLSKSKTDYMRYVLYTLSLAVIFVSSVYINSLISDFIIVYFLGIILAHKNVMNRKSNISAIIALIIVGVVLALVHYYQISVNFYSDSLTTLILAGTPSLGIIRQAIAILLSLSLIVIIRNVATITNIICISGSLTLGIYPLHGVLLHFLKFLALTPSNNVFFSFAVALLIYSASAYFYSSLTKSTLILVLFKGQMR